MYGMLTLDLSHVFKENISDQQVVTDQPRKRLDQVDRAMEDVLDKAEKSPGEGERYPQAKFVIPQ